MRAIEFLIRHKKKRHKPWFAPLQPSENHSELVIVVIVVIVVVAAMVIMIFVAAMIAVMIFIPTVIMFYAAVFAFPITVVEAFAIVTWADPAGAGVRRARPVAFMPAIVSTHGIPITANPDKIWSWLLRNHGNHAWRWWCANPYADRDLSVCGVRASKQKCEQDSDFQ